MCIGWLRLRKYSYIYRVIYLIVIKMLKVVAFMKQVAKGLQMGGNFGTAHVYRSSLNAIIAYRGKGDFTFHEVTPEWLKGFEIHLRGCPEEVSMPATPPSSAAIFAATASLVGFCRRV